MQVLIYLALVLIGIYELIKYLVNQSKGRGGAQYQELQNLVAAALPGESGLRVAYGFQETVESITYVLKVKKTSYARYALAFRSDCLWAAPLAQIRSDELGMVTANASKKKHILFLELYREDRSQPVNCHVEAANRRSSRFHRANIYQQEACAALCAQMERWAQRVNPAHTELQAAWKVEDKKHVNPMPILVLAGVGLVFGLFVGPVGLLFGLIGLIRACVAKRIGAVLPKSCLVLSILSMVVGLLNSIFLLLMLLEIV